MSRYKNAEEFLRIQNGTQLLLKAMKYQEMIYNMLKTKLKEIELKKKQKINKKGFGEA